MGPMDIPGNLVSDSSLVQETFELVRQYGGRVSASEIAHAVFRLSHADELVASALVADLLRNDPRFQIDGSSIAIVLDEFENRPLDQNEFVVLDVEAAHGRSLPPKIIEIGAYRVCSGQIVDEFQTLVNPELPVPAFITSLTGITNQMLRNAPTFPNVARDWLWFAGDAILVAHNTAFDLPLLNREIARVFPGYRMRNLDLCTVKLARRLIPDLDGHNLDSLATHFDIPITSRHRAAADAHATAQILIRLLSQLEDHGVPTLAAARVFSVNGAPGAVGDVQLTLGV